MEAKHANLSGKTIETGTVAIPSPGISLSKSCSEVIPLQGNSTSTSWNVPEGESMNDLKGDH